MSPELAENGLIALIVGALIAGSFKLLSQIIGNIWPKATPLDDANESLRDTVEQMGKRIARMNNRQDFLERRINILLQNVHRCASRFPETQPLWDAALAEMEAEKMEPST